MTLYSTIYEQFFHRIEEDRDFFNYFQLSDEEMMEVANTRASAYMEEAICRITMQCNPTIDFTSRNEEKTAFKADLTANEQYLIASLMFEQYIERDVAYLKRLSVNYTSTELRVFSPDNWRLSFNELYERVHIQNVGLLNQYKNTDRLTGQYRLIDFGSFDTQ